MNELTHEGYLIGYFDVTRYDVVGSCVGLRVGVIVTTSDIYLIHLNELLPVSCRA